MAYKTDEIKRQEKFNVERRQFAHKCERCENINYLFPFEHKPFKPCKYCGLRFYMNDIEEFKDKFMEYLKQIRKEEENDKRIS